jgi:hypothetical protein
MFALCRVVHITKANNLDTIFYHSLCCCIHTALKWEVFKDTVQPYATWLTAVGETTGRAGFESLRPFFVSVALRLNFVFCRFLVVRNETLQQCDYYNRHGHLFVI